jgi:predicted RNA binding protein YcfA (HicA-like mRNA interferase family)
MKNGALRKQLRQAGWQCRQGSGSHQIWHDPANSQRRVVLSGRDGEDAPKYQSARVRKFHCGMMVYEPVER